MAHLPPISPFGPYIRQHLAPLQGDIEQWLTGFEKTPDDVVHWAMTSEEVMPYQFFGWYVHISVTFAGSDEKHKNTFLWEPTQAVLDGK